MNNNNENIEIFDPIFLKKVEKYLTDNTANGQCISRIQICKGLNINPKLDIIIGKIVNLKYISGFKVYMGKGGGIGRANREVIKKAPTKHKSVLDDKCVKEILNKVEEMCGMGSIVSRKKIAEALGDDSAKNQNIISKAIKLPEFNQFKTKPGKRGGIYKLSRRPDLKEHKNKPDITTSVQLDG